MSINLTPKHRAVVRRARLALSLLGEPERRFFIAAMKELWEMTTAPVLADIEWRIAKEVALALALEERLGHEPSDGEAITPSDEKRAEEILEMYPAVDT
jgi:hypothetical protein